MTNMHILTPIAPLAGSNFLAANLYARSIFNEDALVNVSIGEQRAGGCWCFNASPPHPPHTPPPSPAAAESKPDGAIRGHLRIRAKTQGVALALGDRITSKQKA